MRTWAAAISAVVGGLLGACSFQGSVPAGSAIACSVPGSACPSAMTCRAALGYCISDALAGSAPARVYGATIAPASGKGSLPFVLDFQVSAPLAHPPSASASPLSAGGALPAVFPFSCSPCTSALTCECTWTPDLSHLPPEGALQVSVTVVDAAGNTPAPFPSGTFIFDTTPPALVAAPTVVLTAAPGVDTPISELGAGGQVEICFSVDEALGADPQVWLGASGPDAGLPLALALGYPQGLAYCYQATLDRAATLPEGPAGAFATITDLAGNTVTLALGPTADGGALVIVDRTPPAAPDLSDATGLRYHRAPWGELPSIGSPRLAIVSSGPALSEAGTLIAYADSAEEFELGRVAVDEGAAVDLESLPPDPPEVWVDEVDRAGNRLAGGPVRVQQVDWVLNLGRKVKGDLTANPHDCYARPAAGPSLLEADDAVGGLDATTGPTGSASGPTVVQGAANWRKRTTGVPAFWSLSFAYDAAHGQLHDLNQNGLTDTFDGLDWTEAALPVTPTVFADTGVAFDSLRSRVVLFGGTTEIFGSVDVCDTWELGPHGWQEVAPCGGAPDGGQGRPNLPPARHAGCMAYDTARHRTVLAGGLDPNDVQLLDVWDWDGTQWTPYPGAAGPRCAAGAMVYDEQADGGVLVAVGNATPNLAQTWVGRWNGQAYSWEQPLAAWPSSASPEALARDPASGDLVAVVAEDASGGTTAGALWRWDGVSPTGWTRAGPLPGLFANLGPDTFTAAITPLPLQATGPTLQVIAEAETSVGCRLAPFQCAPLHTTEPAALPVLLFGQAAYDELGNGVFTAGLLPANGGQLDPSAIESWQWTDDDWAPLAGPLPAQLGGSVAYWPPTHEFWSAGGINLAENPDPGLWVFTLDGGWREAGTSHLMLDTGALLYIPDAGLDGIVETGSGGPTVLISETGSTLQANVLTISSPTGAATYDAARGKVVLADLAGPLWEATPPSFVYRQVLPDSGSTDAQAIFDDASQTTLLILGGENGESAAGALDRWNGERLTPLPVADPDQDGNPIPIAYQGAASDPATRRIRMLTWSPNGLTTDVWDLTLADNYPALVCQFRFAAAEAPAGSSVERLQVSASAAPGADGGSAVLSLWSRQAWRSVPPCSGAGCDPLTVTVDDPWAVQTLLDDEQTLGVQVTPNSTNGSGLTEVDVTSVQATLTYRLP